MLLVSLRIPDNSPAAVVQSTLRHGTEQSQPAGYYINNAAVVKAGTDVRPAWLTVFVPLRLAMRGPDALSLRVTLLVYRGSRLSIG